MSSDLDFSFSKKELKIRKTQQYKEVFRNGHRVRSKKFNILYASNALGYSRLGLVVAKKNVPSAVRRNRVKRVLREFFRRNKSLFGSNDVLLLANKGSDKLVDYANVRREIEKAIGSNLL